MKILNLTLVCMALFVSAQSFADDGIPKCEAKKGRTHFYITNGTDEIFAGITCMNFRDKIIEMDALGQCYFDWKQVLHELEITANICSQPVQDYAIDTLELKIKTLRRLIKNIQKN